MPYRTDTIPESFKSTPNNALAADASDAVSSEAELQSMRQAKIACLLVSEFKIPVLL